MVKLSLNSYYRYPRALGRVYDVTGVRQFDQETGWPSRRGFVWTTAN